MRRGSQPTLGYGGALTTESIIFWVLQSLVRGLCSGQGFRGKGAGSHTVFQYHFSLSCLTACRSVPSSSSSVST